MNEPSNLNEMGPLNKPLSPPAEEMIYEVPASNDALVPKWLKISYILLPIWGIITFFLYWNGSSGWLDRGYWKELQKAANTTFPIETRGEGFKGEAKDPEINNTDEESEFLNPRQR